MQDVENIDLSQLVTATEAAKMKRMTPNLLAYHLAKEGAPKPVMVGGKHPFYVESEIRAWKPNRAPNKSRKANRKRPAGGGMDK